MIGAVLAIPTAAAIQITISEWRDYRASIEADEKPKRRTKASTTKTKTKSPAKKKPAKKPARKRTA